MKQSLHLILIRHKPRPIQWFMVCFMLSLGSSLAQQIPDNQCAAPGILTGELKTDPEVGCVPLRVKARPTGSSVKNVRYIYEYRGGATTLYQATQDSFHVYKKPGLYVLMQLSETADGKAQRQCKTITVKDTLPPVFRMDFCADGRLTLTFMSSPANNYDNYSIDWGDGKFEIVGNLITEVRHQYSNVSPKKIRVQGIHKQGACGGQTERTVTPTIGGQASTITRLEIKSGNNAEITVSNPNEMTLLLLKQTGNSMAPFTSTGKTLKLKTESLNVLADSNVFTCFKLRPENECAASLESNVLCTVFIKGVGEEDRNVIATTPYLYPSAVKSIEVLRNDQPWKTLTLTELALQDVAPECGKLSCYRLRVSTDKGVSLSNRTCLDPPVGVCGELGSLYIPSAFSPNGDNINDFFEVKSNLSRNFELIVYNKWGAPIFSTDSMNKPWDGRVDGELQPSGVYSYRVSVSDRAGRKFTQAGVVHLLR